MMGIIRCLGCPSWQVIGNIQNQNKMKQIILIIMSLLTFSCSSKAQKQTTDADTQSDKKILVAYFSCTGTTERVADAIAQAVSGKLYRITPAAAYTSADLNWNNKASRSSVEMADEPHAPRWAEKRSICKITMWYSSAIRYGGTCVRVRSIHFLRNMISPVRQSFRLPLPAAVLLQAA